MYRVTAGRGGRRLCSPTIYEVPPRCSMQYTEQLFNPPIGFDFGSISLVRTREGMDVQRALAIGNFAVKNASTLGMGYGG